ncbi:hypothetical protein B6D17_11230, partial [Gilliamella apis]|uniref:hypothetical protein n=1 Tax=Gilliamella apis TaxID=1970738 RepID=UPI000B714552
HGGITATITYSTSDRVRVTLTGPAVTDRNQWYSENPRRIGRPSLPQTFELVGRDSRGNAVVKYGFVLKQWFVSRGNMSYYYYPSMESWCNKIGYRLPKVRDLTNASCQPRRGESQDVCQGVESATPSSPDNSSRRHIGGGLFSEWGNMSDYETNSDDSSKFLFNAPYCTQDTVAGTNNPNLTNIFSVFDGGGQNGNLGQIYIYPHTSGVYGGVCVYP